MGKKDVRATASLGADSTSCGRESQGMFLWKKGKMRIGFVLLEEGLRLVTVLTAKKKSIKGG